MYGWGKGVASHTTLVVALWGWENWRKAQPVAGECPMGYLFLIVPWCLLTYWIQFPKPCCFIYPVQRIEAWGLGALDQTGGKGFSVCVCVCVVCESACTHEHVALERKGEPCVLTVQHLPHYTVLPSPTAAIYTKQRCKILC